MRKTLDKIKSNWKVLLITIVAVVAICSFIDWIWDTYGQDYALMWVSLFIAVIVAIVALSSLKITRDSLELTRATTRPFLMCKPKVKFGTNPAIIVEVENKGIYPADKALCNIELFLETNGQNGEKIIVQSSQSNGVIIFPNQILDNSIGITSEHVQSIQTEQTYIRVTLDYQHKITKNRYIPHKTIRVSKIKKDPLSGRWIYPIIGEKSKWE